MSTYGGYGSYGGYGDVVSTGLGIAGGILIFILLIGIVALVFAILGIIGKWKIFKKRGYKAWECLVPFHTDFVLCEICGINQLWVLISVYAAAVMAVPFLGALLYGVISWYYYFIVGLSVAKSYGKGTGFGIGLSIPGVNGLFYFLLSNDKNQYVGALPVNDFILGKKNNQQPVNNNVQQPVNNFQQPVNNVQQPMNSAPVNNQTTSRFCTGCGKQLADGERFCTGCGKEN